MASANPLPNLLPEDKAGHSLCAPHTPSQTPSPPLPIGAALSFRAQTRLPALPPGPGQPPQGSMASLVNLPALGICNFLCFYTPGAHASVRLGYKSEVPMIPSLRSINLLAHLTEFTETHTY